MRTKQDNWQSFDYENQRYLDAISRLLSFNGNGGCVSVVEYDDKIHVTTNYFGRYNAGTKQWKPNPKYLKNFSQFVDNLNALLKNRDIDSFFKKIISDEKHFYHGNLNQPSEDSLIIPQSFKEYVTALQGLYFKKINYHDITSVRSYIRPMQDLLKIISLFNKAVNLNYVDNDLPSMHAEMKHFQDAGDKIKYYGLNKLSCDPCYSNIKGKSRGNHPITPNKWYDPIKKTLIDNGIIDKTQKLDEGQDLSDDEEIEDNIDMSFFGLNASWYKFKQAILGQESPIFQPFKKMLIKKQINWIEGEQINKALIKASNDIVILSKYHESSTNEALIEVDSVQALKQILQKVSFDHNFAKGVLPLKVNGITKELNINEQQTSHWVGLYIRKDFEKYLIEYIDSMGHPMSKQISVTIQDILVEVNISQPMNGTNKTFIEEIEDKQSLKLTKGIQYVRYDKDGMSFTEDSNINDCGAFITMLLINSWNSQEILQHYLNKLESNSFGQELRKAFQFAVEVVKKEESKNDIDIFDIPTDKQEFKSKDDFDLLDIISNNQELKNVDTIGKTNTFLDECD